MPDDIKISELIKELTKVMNEYGNLPVKLAKDEDEGGYKEEANWLWDVTVDVEPCCVHYECIIHA